MTIINQKSISGITSITTAAAGDNLLTVHTNDGTERLRIDSSGNTRITAGIVTTLTVTGTTTLNGNLDLQDNDKILIGTSDDFAITHDGSNTTFINDTGQIQIRNRADDSDILLQTDNGSGGVASYVLCDGSTGQVDLYHYGTRKLNTKSDGVDVTGELQSDSLDVDGDGDISGNLNLGGELGLLGTEGQKYIDCNLGSSSLNIRGTTGGDAGHTTLAKFTRNGPVELYHNNTKKFETTSSGATVSGSFDVQDGNSGVIVARQTTNNGGYNIFEGEDSSGSTKFYVSHNGRVGASEGIIFGSDTATANLLNDYEEGTWTPSLPNGGTIGATTNATYTRIGRLVMIHLYITSISSIPNNTTEFRVQGLPYDVQGGSWYGAGQISYANTKDLSVWRPLVSNDNNWIYFHRVDGSGASAKNSNFTGTAELLLAIWYFTDA